MTSRKKTKLGQFTGRLYTPCEISAIYRIHLNTVYKLIKKGRFRAAKVGGSWRIKLDIDPGGFES